MDAILIFLTSLGTAYIAARFSGRGWFSLADLVIGVFVGIVGVSLSQVLSAEGATSNLTLPLFLACGLTLGLESLQNRSFWR